MNNGAQAALALAALALLGLLVLSQAGHMIF